MNNALKTTLLFGLLWTVILGLGYLVSWSSGEWVWLVVFAGVGLVSTVWTYWNSATISLKQMGAVQVSEREAPGFYATVRELATQLEMPMPTIWIAPTASPNAFATGRNPKNAAVCCTEGILRLLDARQLRAVLGHELMHVYNRDILSASVASAMAGILTSLAQIVYLAGGRNRNGSALIGFIAVLTAPIAGALIQMGISRSREYAADEEGAILTGDPEALASALVAIEGGVARMSLQPTPEHESAAAVMIANPFKAANTAKLFSTHPPMADRIARLRQQGAEMGQSF
jgi:Zn-dependent protease with chaperone function